jgi:hypothetical protein
MLLISFGTRQGELLLAEPDAPFTLAGENAGEKIAICEFAKTSMISLAFSLSDMFSR